MIDFTDLVYNVKGKDGEFSFESQEDVIHENLRLWQEDFQEFLNGNYDKPYKKDIIIGNGKFFGCWPNKIEHEIDSTKKVIAHATIIYDKYEVHESLEIYELKNKNKTVTFEVRSNSVIIHENSKRKETSKEFAKNKWNKLRNEGWQKSSI